MFNAAITGSIGAVAMGKTITMGWAFQALRFFNLSLKPSSIKCPILEHGGQVQFPSRIFHNQLYHHVTSMLLDKRPSFCVGNMDFSYQVTKVTICALKCCLSGIFPNPFLCLTR